MSEHAVMPIADYKNACDTIRSKTGGTEVIKSGEMAEQISGVYDKGIEQGKQAEWNSFWDNYQQNGNRTNYYAAFNGSGWNNETFKPKYDMKPTTAYMMFRETGITNLANCGVKFDFSNCTTFDYAFAYSSKLKTLPSFIDCSKSNNLQGTFSEGGFVDLHIKVAKTTKFSGTFGTMHELTNFQVDGVIGQNGFNVQWSTKLSKASIESIINCLSTDTSGLSVTLSLTAVKKAFETSEGANDGNTSEEWLNLIATKPNWTIKLV